MDLKQIVNQLIENGELDQVVRDPRAQFGPDNERLIGAELLPERLVTENEFTEEEIRFETTIGNAAGRYTPVQIKDAGGGLAKQRIKLEDDDLGREFKARDYEGVMRLLRNNASMEAEAAIIRWVDVALNRGMTQLNEVYRWQVIVNGYLDRYGDGSYFRRIYYPAPAGHRVTSTDDFTDPAVDPFATLSAGYEFLREKGYSQFRAIAGSAVINKMAHNPNVITRAGAGPLVLAPGGIVKQFDPLQVNMAAMNSMLATNEYGTLERYDARYKTQYGAQYYLPRDAYVIVALTGRQEDLIITTDPNAPDQEPLTMENTLGYHAIGVATGQNEPGRALYVQQFRDKPPRLEGQIWQTEAPVLLDPMAIFVFRGL